MSWPQYFSSPLNKTCASASVNLPVIKASYRVEASTPLWTSISLYERSVNAGSVFLMLAELSKPERVAQIKQDYERRLERLKKQRMANPLRPDNEEIDIDDLYGKSKVCLACHK